MDSPDPLVMRRFCRLGVLTVIAVYFLIFIGGVVRASGAGMGCPDWPTCFGQWIPPTDESQLPANYHDIYAQRGYANTDFNAVKTWTEYLNRLAGVAIGILITLTAWQSRYYWRYDRIVTYLALTVFLLTGVQGWLGAAVVASHLHPFVITLHMLLAWLIVALLIEAVVRSQRARSALFTDAVACARLRQVHSVLLVAMGLTLVQVMMGTQIRESIDVVSKASHYSGRETWREHFPLIFHIHRLFPFVLVPLNAWLAWQIWQASTAWLLRGAVLALSFWIVLAVFAGWVLEHWGMPAWAQPLHLLSANVLFGAQFFLFAVQRLFARAEL